MYIQTRHQIMIDIYEYNLRYYPYKLKFDHDYLIKIGIANFPTLKEEHILMYINQVLGFSLTTKT